MAKASIVFGALALVLLITSFGLGVGVLSYVGIAMAIIGAILGGMSRATKQGKAGLILSLIALSITVLGIALFAPGAVQVQAAETATAK